jgi:diguanylate cyclase (GGDEF)-like protein
MPDNEIPQPNSTPDGATAKPAPPAGAEPVPPAGAEPVPPAAIRASDGELADELADSESSPSAMPATSGRRGSLRSVAPVQLAAAAALACLLAGVLASVIGARAVASSDAAAVRRAFQRTSISIASTLDVAIRHEEQLAVSASTFFAEHPHATSAEFARWKAWARTHIRYPELDALGFLPLSHASPALLASRERAASIYASVPSAGGRGLAIETPVYRGAVTPRSAFGRRAAGIGWVREVFLPKVVLHQALNGQPGYSASLRYRRGAAHLRYSSGAPQAGAERASIALRGGWRMTSYGPPPGGNVLADGDALALLICGLSASALLAMLVLTLARAAAARGALPAVSSARAENAHGEGEGEPSHEELYDALTGLPGRVLMLDRAERLIARTGRNSDAVAGALFVEIDGVPEINDRLGHEAGEELVRVVAQRLEQVIRAGDSVGRLDGEGFVILVESAARGVRLDSLARRAIEALHEPVGLQGFGPSFVLSASVGVAFGRYESPGEMLHDAQQAAAAAGKSRYKLFNANTRATSEGHEVHEGELNAALADRQLFLTYAPIYDLSERRVVGLQALMHWRHPERGVLGPADFVPVARETGLIVPIGRWQLEQACERAAAWNVGSGADLELGARRPGGRTGVSVQVSAEQLSRDGFVTDVRRALQMSGLEPSLLTLDISEPTVIGELAPGAERLHELKRLGVGIALDDFGSRYASHADLQRLPLDCLKVDRASIAASDTEDYRAWLLETILVAGRDLSLPVVVRGVDTPEQLQTLRAMGATIMQGAALGDPAPSESAERLLSMTHPVELQAPPSVL